MRHRSTYIYATRRRNDSMYSSCHGHKIDDRREEEMEGYIEDGEGGDGGERLFAVSKNFQPIR